MADSGGRSRWDKREAEDKAESASTTKDDSSSNGGENSKRNAEKRSVDETEEDSAPPAAAKISKLGFGVSGQTAKGQAAKPQTAKPPPGISIKLATTKAKEVAPAVPKVRTVASVFNEDDSEPEEMPPEAKMRMKNIGRDTPTSAGPNSFNKGKHGFSDNQKLWERNIKARPGEHRRQHKDD
ncbi:PEST proteolytic signal-containing nuclear protein [Ambystoma mexicanum]|uniref:PEST proteolytic signal-containing nuclear protein n=1 Tax=Ambystoma mexicanum TaxID=8296 RepID=UPI0037E7EC67